jgi:hypothetical protein
MITRVATGVEPDELAELCFRRPLGDVAPRHLVLAALWKLYVTATAEGLEMPRGRTFGHTLLAKRSGLGAWQYRSALRELRIDGLLFQDRNGYGLTRAGFTAVREIVDVEQSLALARRMAA